MQLSLIMLIIIIWWACKNVPGFKPWLTGQIGKLPFMSPVSHDPEDMKEARVKAQATIAVESAFLGCRRIDFLGKRPFWGVREHQSFTVVCDLISIEGKRRTVAVHCYPCQDESPTGYGVSLALPGQEQKPPATPIPEEPEEPEEAPQE